LRQDIEKRSILMALWLGIAQQRCMLSSQRR
jgi:hypothetical protein